ncbi:tRNA pseudouridine38-40 synthase [Nitrosomonas eutropha]|uniref:tRNA pseudouridine(38-40) synthase TruA n=1 Tax=Nitrosomonas TaxID=914 RepID=UPI0008855C74|nr:tRNA pseudouridine(38-40) synthase TruA [Nitrosomonas eutropha]MXS79447.1 tRNA pseudouridine(38-40) synthase TruA [Nitrosomonas sp. GH22]SCX09038.1 tRNA pseudouridine38-40 synthase [Nitrosomonas eutropha]SDV99458.1 tRNA pseudouridine38-40 synthase [Nitrosomonas eutropha]
MKIVLILEYDGRGYCGWQKQPDRISVQSRLESALSRIASSQIQVVAAGRTDAGVHALCQVVHFETHVIRPLTAWVRGANALLPDDISVLWASEVNDDFHARFSATERTYLYYLLSRPARPGIFQEKTGWTHYSLDLEKMQTAARFLIGEYDFSAFRSAECQAKNAIRKLIRLDISQSEQFFVFEFCANAFLHHMVRNILGALIYIGQGKHPPEWMQVLLGKRDRTLAAPTFAPDGLYLAGVRYDARWNLPTFNVIRPENVINMIADFKYSQNWAGLR